jgi:hypothetical protein
VLRHLIRRPELLVVHRVNECDERKNTRGINAKLIRANYVADATVFVGEWLMRLPAWLASPPRAPRTIRNGADRRIFHARGFKPWNGSKPMRLVTHHWGHHALKGFDVYAAIDRLLDDPSWQDRIAFTFVGNLPKGFAFKNARHIAPLDGDALADELRRHHTYLTASINEPGGNHQNEGALCGLPLLFRRSGCLPEYCEGFGIGFDPPDIETALRTMFAEYPEWTRRMPDYPHDGETMCRHWLDLFDNLIRQRDAIVATRRLWREPLRMIRLQIPL